MAKCSCELISNSSNPQVKSRMKVNHAGWNAEQGTQASATSAKVKMACAANLDGSRAGAMEGWEESAGLSVSMDLHHHNVKL